MWYDLATIMLVLILISHKFKLLIHKYWWEREDWHKMLLIKPEMRKNFCKIAEEKNAKTVRSEYKIFSQYSFWTIIVFIKCENNISEIWTDRINFSINSTISSNVLGRLSHFAQGTLHLSGLPSSLSLVLPFNSQKPIKWFISHKIGNATSPPSLGFLVAHFHFTSIHCWSVLYLFLLPNWGYHSSKNPSKKDNSSSK